MAYTKRQLEQYRKRTNAAVHKINLSLPTELDLSCVKIPDHCTDCGKPFHMGPGPVPEGHVPHIGGSVCEDCWLATK